MLMLWKIKFPRPSADHALIDNVWHFKSYYEAKEYLQENRDGFPDMRVLERDDGWIIQLCPDGRCLGPVQGLS